MSACQLRTAGFCPSRSPKNPFWEFIQKPATLAGLRQVVWLLLLFERYGVAAVTKRATLNYRDPDLDRVVYPAAVATRLPRTS
jgi:hypothetical protein